MLEPIVLVILLAFVAGLIFKSAGYPPLLGYLLAGFVAHGLGMGDRETIVPVADLGILLLLFTIGLKLNLRELAAPQVWGVAGMQTLIMMPLTALVFVVTGLLIPSTAMDTSTVWLMAFALSFSSTVFAVKMFDERGENAALYAVIAIGILIVQDLMAVFYLVISSGKLPSVSAIVLVALPLLRPPLLWILRKVGHGELLVLFGICLAVLGAVIFEGVQLKGSLGGLMFGILIGNTLKSKELYKNLINFKDIFLIGFFINIGYNGFPSHDKLIVVLVLCLLVFLRPAIYFFLLVFFRLRSRTSLLTSLSLFNYSEFGLIVAALAFDSGLLSGEWVTTLALAMALSFFIAVPFNTRVHLIYAHYASRLQQFERRRLIFRETPVALGKARIVVLGMGRVGLGAYQYLCDLYPDDVIGADANMDKVQRHNADGIRCVHGDATDSEFLLHADLASRDLIFVSLSNHSENIEVVRLLKQLDYIGDIAVVARYNDDQQALKELGCITFNLYAEAGHGFAEDVLQQIQNRRSTPDK